MITYTFEIESDVAAPKDEVWRQATDMRAVNLELHPLLRMTYPKRLQDLNEAVTPLQHQLFRSWVLLFGVLPIDYYDVNIVAFEPESRLLERSTTLNFRLWQHERIIECVPSGARIMDRIIASPRVGCLGPLFREFVRYLFILRHKNLLKRFGEAAPRLSCTDLDSLESKRKLEEILVK